MFDHCPVGPHPTHVGIGGFGYCTQCGYRPSMPSTPVPVPFVYTGFGAGAL